MCNQPFCTSTNYSSFCAVHISSSHADRERASEFVELHDQVDTSVNLLDSLESFLSGFQKDLSAVSGQISELQDRSKDIDNRLKSRRKIEKPLANLLSDITIPPSIAILILDSDVGECWIVAIGEFEQRLNTLNARTRVKAARDLGEVAEGLRIVAATKLRAFFLALFQPIRSNVTTNMQVLQTSILLKYRPLFSFLQRQAPSVAQEIQRSYIGAARLYYETGFRRYSRSLGWIKTRTTEKSETIVAGIGDKDSDLGVDVQRLAYGKIEGPGTTLAYMADDKNHKEPVEALLRSLLLVLMDNATAEYTFLTTFFTTDAPLLQASKDTSNSLFSPTIASANRGRFFERQTHIESESGGQTPIATGADSITIANIAAAKDDQSNLDTTWKQILDPVLEYTQTFVRSVLDPTPPTIPLLTMIRLTEDVIAEVQKRRCPPLESFIFSIRLQMWPIFQKAMAEHIDALKKLPHGASFRFFSKEAIVTDASVTKICKCYVVLFNSFIALTEQEEETMIFSNLNRLRQELALLILRHTNAISDSIVRATTQSTLFESLLQELSKAAQSTTHPKFQKEVAFWAEKEEEARRRIISVRQVR